MKKISSFFLVLLLMLASFTAGLEYPRGDVNYDGQVSIADATCLIDYLLNGYWHEDPVTPPDTHEYVDLGLPSGTLWATMNIGANAPGESGDYFAWGETEPKDYYDWTTYKWCNSTSSRVIKYCTNSSDGHNGFTDGKTELEPADDAAYVNWGHSWRMPTMEQIQELVGQKGTGPNGNTIFLPAAGGRWYESLNSAGDWGLYWSRSLYLDDCIKAYYLDFYSNGIYWNLCQTRYGGLPVRAVREPNK